MQKWYMCKRDIGVTLVVTVLSFFYGPKFDDVFPFQLIENIHPYMGLLIGWGYITALAFVLVGTFFIHLEHYWQWSVVALFSTTGARCAGQIILSADNSVTVYEFVWGTIANGLFYFPFVMPVVAVVFFVKRKIKRR